MKGIIFVLLCIIVGSWSASDVIDLNLNNFNEKVLQSELPIMVEFFAPWCGHCKALAPEWEKAATNLKGILPVAKVDCTTQESLCSKYQVKGYPTIKCFSEKGKKIQDYQQQRQASSIVRFATDQLPNNIVSVKNVDSHDKFMSKDEGLPHVLLFTSKSEVSSLMKSLAVSFKGRVVIGQVQQSSKEVVEKYNVDSFPTLLSVKQGEEPHVYDGTITPDNVRKFISELVGDSSSSSEDSTDTKTETQQEPVRKAKPKSTATLKEVTSDDIDEVCASALCVVGFVDSNEEHVVNEEQAKVLNGVLGGFKGDGKFLFVWADKKNQKSLVEKFSLSGDEPSLIVYNAKRSKYAKSEAFELTSAHKLLERVVGGDVPYTKL